MYLFKSDNSSGLLVVNTISLDLSILCPSGITLVMLQAANRQHSSNKASIFAKILIVGFKFTQKVINISKIRYICIAKLIQVS